jgi:hypothetical protein
MWDAFASHAWGADGENHERVRRYVTLLRSMNMSVWFDEYEMRDNILDAMSNGIDHSRVFVAFLDKTYVDKVRSGDESDNVRREFMYGQQQRSGLILPVRLDSDLGRMSGPVGMIVGSHLYVDATGGDDALVAQSIHEAIARMVRRSSSNDWRSAWNRTRAATPTSLLPPIGLHRTAPLLPRARSSHNTTVRGRVQRIGRELHYDRTTTAGEVVQRALLTLRPHVVARSPSELSFQENLELVEKHLFARGALPCETTGSH